MSKRPSGRIRARRAQPPETQTPTVSIEYLPRASVWVRLAALVYDLLLVAGLVAVVLVALVALLTPRDAADAQTLTVLSPHIRLGVLLPAALGVVFLFYGYCWTHGGSTLGMQTWRLRARHANGDAMTWGDSWRRYLAALMVPFFMLGLAWLNGASSRGLASAFSAGLLFNYAFAWLPLSRLPRGRCLHDWISTTDVLRVPKKPKA